MPSSCVCLLANPAAGRGRAARMLPAVRAAFAAYGIDQLFLTERSGDEARLARHVISLGFSTIAVVGGDGTWSRVAAALVACDGAARLVPVAAGSGNDFAKSLRLPAQDFPAIARLAANEAEHRIDVGRIDDHVFVNAAGFGLDVAVVEECDRTTWLRGDALYLYAALRHLFRYQGFRARYRESGIGSRESRAGATASMRSYLTIVIANGERFGGSFHIAPDARLDDGQLDVVSIGSAGPLRRMAVFGAARRGAHVRAPEVSIEQRRALTLDFERVPTFEADGELYQARGTAVEVSCIPSALRVVRGD
jgi:diacylglycerol kinase (ATP)